MGSVKRLKAAYDIWVRSEQANTNSKRDLHTSNLG